MLLIVEGCDGVGKTTLAKAFVKKLGFRYEHFSLPVQDPLTMYYRPLTLCGKDNVLFDRFAISNLVYEPIFRPKEKFISDHQYRVILRKVRALGGVMILCETRLEEIKKNVVNDWYVKAKFVKQIKYGFRRLIPILGISSIRYDYMKEKSPEQFIDGQVEFLKKRQDMVVEFDGLNTEGYGSLKPTRLYVGEQINHRNNSGYKEPFIGGCGSYLTKLLIDEYGADLRSEEDFHFTNAIKSDDRLIQQDELDFLRPKVVVCLGNKAYELMRRLKLSRKVELIKRHHPQYLKRFKHNISFSI